MEHSQEAARLADLFIQEWISSYSDNGAIWTKHAERLRKAKEAEAQHVIDEALEIARARWYRMHNVGS